MSKLSKCEMVARERAHFFASFERKHPAAVKLHLVEPIANREIPNPERHHRLNEGKRGCCAFSSRTHSSLNRFPPLSGSCQRRRKPL
jgi:hypothetical protein